MENSILLGSQTATPLNTAMSVTGSNALVTLLGNSLRLFVNGVTATGGASLRILSTNFETTTNSLICSGASIAAVVGCNFIVNNFGAINVNSAGAGTIVALDGCQFNCTGTDSANQGTALKVATGATIYANASSIENAVLAVACGEVGDTSSTSIIANALSLINSTTDIIQLGSSSLAFSGGIFDYNKVVLADSTNINFSAFDPRGDFVSGSGADVADTVYEIFNGQSSLPELIYHPNYYGYKGTVYENSNNNPTFNATQSNLSNASYYVVTGDRTKDASISLISDTANIGTGDNVRGWGITKLGTSASLAFTYTNNDTSGQLARGSNAVMQLNGFDNQVETET